MIDSLAVDLSRRIPPDQIIRGADAGRYSVDGRSPSLAVLPRTVDEVSALLQFAGEHEIAVVPWGGGTLMDLGNPPRRADLVLDLSRLDAVSDYSPEDLVVSAQAGVTLGALNQRLAGHGQLLALDPPLVERATVGGALSANIWGPSRLRYGTARDLVIGLTCVLSGGEIVHSGGRVVKNVAGYDMNKLYLGAVGTLGVIAEASFKLHPLPAAQAGLVATFANCQAAHAAALAIVNSPFNPTAVEIGGPSTAGQLLAGERAVLTAGGWFVAVLVSGLPAAVERQKREIERLARDAAARDVAILDDDLREHLFRRLRDYGRDAVSQAAMILRAAVLPSEIPEAVSRLEAAAGEAQAEVLASPGSGLVRLFWTAVPPAAAELVGQMRAAIDAMGGNLVIERCPVELKTHLDVWGIDGADLVLMREMKAAFDPRGILSPGRFVDGL